MFEPTEQSILAMDTTFKWCFSEILVKNSQLSADVHQTKQLLRESRLVQVALFLPLPLSSLSLSVF